MNFTIVLNTSLLTFCGYDGDGGGHGRISSDGIRDGETAMETSGGGISGRRDCVKETGDADAEAIRSPIHAFLLVQCSMCEMDHYHHEKGFSSSLNMAVSSSFRQPMDPIMQHNMLQ